MNKKYMTVSEFAEKAGVSKQTIYDQMSEGKRLAPYRKKISGKLMLRSDALSYYTAGNDAAPETETETTGHAQDDPMITILLEQLRVKDQQLAEKDKQLAARDAEIQSLTEAIKATTAVQYRLQDQIKLLGDNESNPAESTPEAEKPAETPPAAAESHTESTDQSTGGFFGWFRKLWS